MLFEFLAMIPQTGPVEGPTPTLSNVALTHSAGVCSGISISVSARITVNWSETNFNSALHEHRIYQDNVLIATLGAASSYSKFIPGVIEDGCGSSWQSDWVFRVDTVRKSNGGVLASVEATANVGTHHIWYYGTCCGGGAAV